MGHVDGKEAFDCNQLCTEKSLKLIKPQNFCKESWWKMLGKMFPDGGIWIHYAKLLGGEKLVITGFYSSANSRFSVKIPFLINELMWINENLNETLKAFFFEQFL